MSRDKLHNGEIDNTTHSLLSIKRIPESLTLLRRELAKPENAAISTYAMDARTFEEALARIAEKLDIVVDGFYDVEPLALLLFGALRNKQLPGSALNPHLRTPGLVNAEIVETAGEITVTEVPDAVLAMIEGETELPSIISRDREELKKEPQHTCGWPGCNANTPTRMWGCQKHWTYLPLNLRADMYVAFNGGILDVPVLQERYEEVNKQLVEWAKESQRYKKEQELVIPSIPVSKIAGE